MDATNWTIQSSGTMASWTGISYGDGAFCALRNGLVVTSADGVSWKERNPPYPYPGGVRFLNGTFFIFGSRNILQSGPVAPVQLQAIWNSGHAEITIVGSPNLLMRLQSAD